MPPLKTNLQAMRKRAGFKSAKDFAEKYGFNVGSYTNYEQGKVGLSLEKAWEFADLLNCTLDELAGRIPPDQLSDPLTAEERLVVDGYRVADGRQQRRILSEARLELEMAEEDAQEKKEAL